MPSVDNDSINFARFLFDPSLFNLSRGVSEKDDLHGYRTNQFLSRSHLISSSFDKAEVRILPHL